MPLPVKPLPESSVEVNGERVDFRSLSRAEAMKLQDYRGREDEAEIMVVSWATSISADEVAAFRESTPAKVFGVLTDAILVFSGLASQAEIDEAEAKGKDVPDPKPDTSEPS